MKTFHPMFHCICMYVDMVCVCQTYDLSYNTKIWTDLSSILSQITRLTDRQTDWRTDGRTDGRTDRIIIARPRLHCMQRGENDMTWQHIAKNNVTVNLLTRLILGFGALRPPRHSPFRPGFSPPLQHYTLCCACAFRPGTRWGSSRRSLVGLGRAIPPFPTSQGSFGASLLALLRLIWLPPYLGVLE